MNLREMIAQLRTQRSAQLDQRQAHERAISTTFAAIGTGTATEAQETELRTARDAIAGIDTQITQLQEREAELQAQLEADERAASMRNELAGVGAGQRGAGGAGQERDAARVLSEPRTYSARESVSFFADMYAAERSPIGAVQARERLERHGREVIVEREQNAGMQQRAVATGGFGGLVVPQYLVDMAARVIRSGRPVANAVNRLELPAEGMSLIIPRGTTGAAVASQATENTGVQNTDEVWSNLQVPVVTIAGQQDVSRQSLERGTPGLDGIIYMDIAGAYHAELDRQIINGSGASGQMLGMIGTTGKIPATAFGAAPTGQAFYLKTAGVIGGMAGVGAGIQPQLIIMNPRRWAWLTAQFDSQGRPYVIPVAQGPTNGLGVNSNPGAYGGDGHGDPNDAGGYSIVGYFQGLPVITDANVPINLGTPLEDAELIVDPRHMLLWEDGDGMPRQLRFDQTLGNQLTVKLVAYGYAAFTGGRYPQAIGQVGGYDATAGQGLVAPAF